MKARAKVWLKRDNKWLAPGTEFEIDEAEAAGIAQYADLTGEPEEKPEPAAEPNPKPRAARSRKK